MSLRGGLKLKESQIEMMIGHLLKHLKLCFYKQNTRGYFNSKLKRFVRDQNPYAMTGLPDYVVIYKGLHCGLEVKTEEGRQTPNQKEFEEYLKKKGEAHYYVVRSVDEAQKCLTEFKTFAEQFTQSRSM